LDEHRFDWLPPRARPCVNESVLRANSESNVSLRLIKLRVG